MAMGSDALSSLPGWISQKVYLILFVITAYFVVGRARDYWRLRQFKGPVTAGVSSWWHSSIILSGQAHQYYGEATEKYGEGDNVKYTA